jgi:hypothetical protein
MVNDGDRLSNTIKLSEEIMQLGGTSGLKMSETSDRLKKVGRNLKKIEKSVIPGIDQLLGKLGRVKLRNTVIIALVISICLVILIYNNGFKMILN